MNSYSSLVVCAILAIGCAKSDKAANAPDATKRDTLSASSKSPDVAVLDSTVGPDGKMTPGPGTTAAIPKAPSSAANGPRPSGPSTQIGVYTNEQADRGKQVYAASCRSCHSPTSHTGQVFVDWWQNKRLSDLYNYIASEMPKNDPGTLAPEDVADVVAYLLKMNAMPTGKSELYPDTDSLKKFWIDARPGK